MALEKEEFKCFLVGSIRVAQTWCCCSTLEKEEFKCFFGSRTRD